MVIEGWVLMWIKLQAIGATIGVAVLLLSVIVAGTSWLINKIKNK